MSYKIPKKSITAPSRSNSQSVSYVPSYVAPDIGYPKKTDELNPPRVLKSIYYTDQVNSSKLSTDDRGYRRVYNNGHQKLTNNVQSAQRHSSSQKFKEDHSKRGIDSNTVLRENSLSFKEDVRLNGIMNNSSQSLTIGSQIQNSFLSPIPSFHSALGASHSGANLNRNVVDTGIPKDPFKKLYGLEYASPLDSLRPTPQFFQSNTASCSSTQSSQMRPSVNSVSYRPGSGDEFSNDAKFDESKNLTIENSLDSIPTNFELAQTLPPAVQEKFLSHSKSEKNNTPTKQNNTPTKQNNTPTKQNNTPTKQNSTPTKNYNSPKSPLDALRIKCENGFFKPVKGSRYIKITTYKNIDTKDSPMVRNLIKHNHSFGWVIEQISPPKSATDAKKDFNKTKRKLDFSNSPSPKKNKAKHSCLDGRDIKSNQKSSSESCESKEMNSISVTNEKPIVSVADKKHFGLPNCDKKSERISAAYEFPKLSYAESSNSTERRCHSSKQTNHSFSPEEKAYVPSELNGRMHKNERSNGIDNSNMEFLSSKKDRHAVYSGRKTAIEGKPPCPSLRRFSVEVAKKYIQNYKIRGDVSISPDSIKAWIRSLGQCNPTSSQLHRIELRNRHIVRYTSSLWENMCKKEYPSHRAAKGEHWKDVYYKAQHSENKKLKTVTSHVSKIMAKVQPERQAMFISVDASNPEMRHKKIKVEDVRKVGESSRSEANGKNAASSSSFTLKLNSKTESPKLELNGRSAGTSSSLNHRTSHVLAKSGSERSSSSSPHSAPKITTRIVKPNKKSTPAPLMKKSQIMMNNYKSKRH